MGFFWGGGRLILGTSNLASQCGSRVVFASTTFPSNAPPEAPSADLPPYAQSAGVGVASPQLTFRPCHAPSAMVHSLLTPPSHARLPQKSPRSPTWYTCPSGQVHSPPHRPIPGTFAETTLPFFRPLNRSLVIHTASNLIRLSAVPTEMGEVGGSGTGGGDTTVVTREGGTRNEDRGSGEREGDDGGRGF